MQTISKLAIANRGEVAVRIINACNEMEISTLLLHSEADVNSRAYRMADETICIGPAPSSLSYLNIEANINGALGMGAEAIHPGFGFLSENADFAKACEESNIIFVGPSSQSISLFGDKLKAKSLVSELNIPMIPGYEGANQDLEVLQSEADKIGYPLIVKAAAGGGGRGLKVVQSKEELKSAAEAAQREALSSFANAEVFLEKYLDKAKHIEVQIFADASGKVFHLGERECSVQRKHQKVVEEAPSANLSGELREQIFAAAIKIAEAAKYGGAGTVEFLVQDGNFYFLEMNTRLQVEHPVTEMVMGVDLVKAQILTAQKMSLPWVPSQMAARGHSIECRLYAEDPYSKGIPSTGELLGIKWPEGPGRRFDFGFDAGDEITAHYDPMIAKLIVWDETRVRAIEKMKHCLQSSMVFGLKTNIPYLLRILNHPDFVDGTMTTGFIEQNFSSGLKAEAQLDEEEMLEQLKLLVDEPTEGSQTSQQTPNPWSHSHWSKN